MTWWQKLKKNPLARFGASLLVIFYLVVLAADFIAPYHPYESQPNGSLLPPTAIYLQNRAGEWIGPHVYPTTQGPTDIQTGEREIKRDLSKPAPIRLFAPGYTYNLFQIRLPIGPKFQEKVVFPGISWNRHLFGTVGEANINLLGTDEQARDQFSRLIHGGRISLSIGLFGIAISFPLGLLIGGISGYFGGWIDAILMRVVEVIMTFPSIYLLVALAAVLLNLQIESGLQLSNAQRFLLIVVVTSFIGWAGLARVIRGQVLSIKEREFVQAARAMGANPFYVIVRHILPQTTTYIIISATLAIPSYILAEAVLSLIGLGIQQPDPSWGNLLSVATNASMLVLQPWLIWPPALMIILTVLAFNLLGDGLRDALDPRAIRR